MRSILCFCVLSCFGLSISLVFILFILSIHNLLAFFVRANGHHDFNFRNPYPLTPSFSVNPLFSASGAYITTHLVDYTTNRLYNVFVMRRYRKSAFKLKLKKQTIYTISSLGLLGAGVIVVVSFTQQGEFLTTIYNILVSYFGWGTLLLPILLISTSILFSGLKLKIAKLNVPAGLTLFWISILGLTRTGLIGDQLWLSIENLITGVGAFFMLLGVSVIGIVVLFNTSLSDAFEFV